MAASLQLPSSATTLLRLVRAAPVSHVPILEAVGFDEWAWRRGHRYATILVNLADHRLVDLLSDRSAATVAAWLARHPTLTVVCRDRSDLYADGIRRGLPNAVQVVDRFHLIHNLRQALEAFLSHYRSILQAAALGDRIARKLLKAVEAFHTYLENNKGFIPNYGERYRHGEWISTGVVESTVNQVVSKRFYMRLQILWTNRAAHLLLQTRVKTLNHELASLFRRWYPDSPVEEDEWRAA
jgi:Transposase